jgi:hypothetical protein
MAAPENLGLVTAEEPRMILAAVPNGDLALMILVFLVGFVIGDHGSNCHACRRRARKARIAADREKWGRELEKPRRSSRTPW